MQVVFRAVYEGLPEVLGLTEESFRREAMLRWQEANGEVPAAAARAAVETPPEEKFDSIEEVIAFLRNKLGKLDKHRQSIYKTEQERRMHTGREHCKIVIWCPSHSLSGEKDCVTDAAPWAVHELPTLRSLPHADLVGHEDHGIDNWMEDRERKARQKGGEGGQRPSVMDVIGANTTWTREELSRDTLRRWALQFRDPTPEKERLNVKQWLEWEQGNTGEEEPIEGSWWNGGIPGTEH
ncbi:hypothetical protein CYMTET_4824 [Cymbomonas tetramitiformis]|uniref:Uncharacterized protein n=1 Tax=Cymbomonas tetramitiformis TaxID=36881 RepID=A0AAE0LJQ5_9CHLO|nr:hypothetical protein CYMTET_4824 [Cymbomonas tetramitiformis]